MGYAYTPTMAEPPDHSLPETAEAEALRWLAVLRSGRVSKAERRAFAEWLAEDPRRQSAWREAQAFWSGLERLDPSDVREIRIRYGAASATPPLALQRRLFLALPLALVLLVAFGLILYPPAFLYADYTTAAGEARSVLLAAGSRVELNTATALSVDDGEERRRITLHTGEAFFTVAPDPRRPFEVLTTAGRIRALGTAFNVRALDGRVEVAVYEHAVAIALPSGQSLAQLTRNEQVSFDAQGFGVVAPADLRTAGAWRRHRLVFEDRALAEVVGEINRYRRGRIVVANPALASLPVSGVFDTRDTGAALRTIEETLKLRRLALTERLVFLY